MAFEKMDAERKPWLAMGFGCCASRDDVVDEECEASRIIGTPGMQICYEEPRSVPQPRAEPTTSRPTTSHSIKQHVSQWVMESRETLALPRRSQSKPRPSISGPMDFKHCDGLDGIQSMVNDASAPIRRRQSYRPLELSFYFPDGRLSPLPDFCDNRCSTGSKELEVPAEAHVHVRDSRTNSLSSNPSNSSYLIQRKPVGSGSQRSSMQSQKSFSTHERRLSGTTMATMATPTLAFLEEEPRPTADSLVEQPPTLQRSRTSGTLSPPQVLSRLSSPSRARANTAPTRPGSLRRARTDVDEAIRELNTIVEERRASAYRSYTSSPALINRPPPSPSHHVPFIAPTMRMHVRSETLSDIGSAFSTPLDNKPLPTPPQGIPPPMPRRLTLYPPSRVTPGALTSNPITPPAPTTPPAPVTPNTATAITRLGAWIKRSIPTNTTSPSFPSSTSLKSQPSVPFYKCEPQAPLASRPSTAGSRTLCHTRQDSQDSEKTATVTLRSSSSRSPSPTSDVAAYARANVLKGQGKTRRVPAPLILIKDKEILVEAALGSARSTRSLKPPQSPHYGLLRGMELTGKDVGVNAQRSSAFVPSPSAVGVAF
ncbi:hypothetical protein P153DRAFT_343689 [Dothidotthia symphoricarpi CBS 119687]|uniref:Uncharacterized protein n=1 Tax=Dothidotthia symphoricarpi CBS 119687 TaxID=1392245 RepID=A0A6A6A7H6_9PLEO|nr:uncharacterized protein P153DRAFT_343689 [Dothidotthia symphoricarpi CBS 119687]KAF2127536.1 hypothetical protein P153DRAFT_343689 [Dothidotthia symphoricarpi CBS 119687]